MSSIISLPMPQELPAYADVILPLALPQYYTYSIPSSMSEKVFIGIRVTVLFGQRKLYTGIIRRLHNEAPEGFQLNEILALLDDRPIVTLKQLEFWEWIADYYLCTTGEVFRAALPSGLKLESETRLFPDNNPPAELSLLPSEEDLMDLIIQSPGITIQKLAILAGRKDVTASVKSLIQKGTITREENIREIFKPKTYDFILLNEEYREAGKLNELADHVEKKAPNQFKILLSFLELGGSETGQEAIPVPKEKLLGQSAAGHATLNALIKKGVFSIRTEEISRLTVAPDLRRKPYTLNKSQLTAHLSIIDEFTRRDVVLLHGVTSSGKTEIYIHLIEHYIRQNQQVLYLLPEIALTAQMINRLRNVFGDKVGVYHSKFTDAERVEVYENLAGMRKLGSPSYQIILGVRSSIFLPFDDLGLIIIDEEHENSYKQFDPAPRYNARDAAVVLAASHGAKVLMGTATPSFESYMNAMHSRYGLVELNERFRDILLPEITIVDVREARRRKQMESHFAPQLLDAISDALKCNEQVLLFQNRRGFSPYIECNACGWIPHCKHCDVSLTYHKKTNRLNCHYCGFSIPNPPSCSSCGDTDIRTRGFGTEKVEDEIKIFFPDARVMRMDMDTTRTRKSYERIINDFENRKTDILIGTQMVSKGLDFDHVRVVGIMNADNMMNFPDFRSFERSYQLIAQVSGRAGRKNNRGKVLVQTNNPEHPVIQHVLENSYKAFFMQQLRERQIFKYPPYYRLVKLTLRHKKLPLVNQASQMLAASLRKALGERVVGPEFPLIGRLYSLHQKCILVKIERDKHFTERRNIMRSAIEGIMIHNEFKGLQIIPDVDPYN
jgi:primosomal protein N' (replication factor Y) (superfamily II helicase)